MMRALILVALACQAQEAPETALLEKVKAKVAENLGRLPNFTCTETIQRSLWFKHNATPQMVDTVRLEVAYVQGKELYGWPGSSRIDETDIGKMAGGSVGNGYFALFLNNIFRVQYTAFHYVGRSKLDGKDALQYDYSVPQSAGAYRLRSAQGAAMVGYHGSFWVPEGSVDPVRINVVAEDVPADIGFSAATSLLNYGVTTIGDHSYVLPKDAEFVFTDTGGTEHRSRLSFQTCHEFVGEAVIKFTAPPPEDTITLPADFTVDANLVTRIDSATSAGGDPIEAMLREKIELNGKTVAPKGAKLSGRIGHITKNGPAYVLDFAFTSIDFEGGHADLTGRENHATVQEWPRLQVTDHLILGRGTRLTLHSHVKAAN
jgi:hypothetical protein